MWEELAALPGPVQRCALDGLAAVPHGARVSDLERSRKVPAPRGSGQSVVKYLDQIAEISGLGLADLGVEGLVPPRRLAELALYRMTASASLICRHQPVKHGSPCSASRGPPVSQALTYETVSLAGSDQGVEPLQTPPARRRPP